MARHGESGLRVLIIDDSAVMRKMIERALRQAGIPVTEVAEASNGSEAMELLRAAQQGEGARFGLILSDINMPLMDGLAFAENRRTEGLLKGVPLVMISTENSEHQVLRAVAAGANSYLCKPFTAEQLRLRLIPLLHGAM